MTMYSVQESSHPNSYPEEWTRQSTENRDVTWYIVSRAPVMGLSDSGHRTATPTESDPDMRMDVVPAQVRAEILSYQRPNDYYGEGSLATSDGDCVAALFFLEQAKKRNIRVEMPSSISPSVDGGIALYWEKGDCQLFIEVSGRVGAELSYQHVSADGTFSTGTATGTNLIESLSAMYS